jgi:hypothetical protein
MVVIRAQERKATLMGDNAPLRVDPIQLAETAAPKPNSTQAMLEVLERSQAEDTQALRNGGPGYGDWRDERDREEMARKAEFEARQRVLAPDDDDD